MILLTNHISTRVLYEFVNFAKRERIDASLSEFRVKFTAGILMMGLHI